MIDRKLFHDEKECKAKELCPLHGGSEHHMVHWELIYRYDRGIFERICRHGVGHPDPDNSRYLIEKCGVSPMVATTHGCCGCCNPNLNVPTEGTDET